MRAFDRLAQLWDRNARSDALWSILALPGKERGGWREDEFFATGERDVTELFRYLAERQAVPRTRRALDFGCGVGRLTRALATRYASVDGVDISPAMIERARHYATDSAGIRYHVGGPDLSAFDDGTFDLVLSILVLQHIPPDLSQTYVREFARVAAHGGILLFQVPSARRRPERRRSPLARVAARVLHHGRVVLDMYPLPRTTVERILSGSSCEILDVRGDGWAGDEWESFLYLARRAPR